MVFARERTGKFFAVVKTEAAPLRAGGGQRRKANPQGDWIRAAPNPEEEDRAAIIDRETWNQCELIMLRRKTAKTPRFGSFPLPGLVRCGHCNANMTACAQIKRQGRHGERTYRKVFCGTYNRGGKSRCNFNAVDADKLLRLTVEKLKRALSDPKFQKALLEDATHEDSESRQQTGNHLAELKTELARPERKVEKAAAKMIDEENADVAPALREELRKRQQKRNEVAAQVKALEDEAAKPRPDRKAEADEFLAFGERLEEAGGEELQDALLNLVDYIELFFDHAATPKGRRWSRFAYGFIYLRPGWIADVICNYIGVTHAPERGTDTSGGRPVRPAGPRGAGAAIGPRRVPRRRRRGVPQRDRRHGARGASAAARGPGSAGPRPVPLPVP
jgi:hypothetical protein